MTTTICLVRHGQTDWNKAKIIQGRLNNPLNDEGRKQIRELGQKIKATDPSWDLIISSPLDRAYETAQIIAQSINYQGAIIKDFDVIEREFGEAEGKNICKEIYDEILKDNIIGIEKTKELQERAFNAIIKIANSYPGKKILITTHSHFIKGLFTVLSNEITFTSTLYNASLNYVTVDNNKIISFSFNK